MPIPKNEKVAMADREWLQRHFHSDAMFKNNDISEE
jgi:hypothetical protein